MNTFTFYGNTSRNKYPDYLTKILENPNDSEMSDLSDSDSEELEDVIERNISEMPENEDVHEKDNADSVMNKSSSGPKRNEYEVKEDEVDQDETEEDEVVEDENGDEDVPNNEPQARPSKKKNKITKTKVVWKQQKVKQCRPTQPWKDIMPNGPEEPLTPLSYFRKMRDKDLLDLMVEESNKYAFTKNPEKPLALSVPELKIYRHLFFDVNLRLTKCQNVLAKRNRSKQSIRVKRGRPSQRSVEQGLEAKKKRKVAMMPTQDIGNDQVGHWPNYAEKRGRFFAFDSMYISYTTHVVIQLRMLKYKLIYSVVNADIGTVYNCIKHHQFLLLIFERMNQLYFWLFLFHYFLTLITGCTQLYIILLGEADVIHLVSTTIYIVGLLVEFGLWSFPVEEFVFELSDISNAIYMSNWYEADKLVKNILLTIMMRAQKQKYMSAGGLMNMNIDTFGSVNKVQAKF
ncbi:7tm Odorant receptor [Popillia japonica]|uniref:Odorant receptor n=1 Tax=Popillia japonica TaxID=7064 RepID=A0AAW1IX24_POPJA